ncbi:MAG: protein tyrosine phosphatase [Proteobacteria bacterium]|nr:protein tyrosine phosphatase [Pseudomonadota bacterium]
MFNSILVVCIGNICRSPTGERLLQHYLPDKRICSAGVSALVGHPMDELAAEVACEHGLDPRGHVARQLTPEMCRENDLILVMSQSNLEQICRISPESRGRVMLYGKWQGNTEIPDPYMRERAVYEQVYSLLETNTQAWVEALQQ